MVQDAVEIVTKRENSRPSGGTPLLFQPCTSPYVACLAEWNAGRDIHPLTVHREISKTL